MVKMKMSKALETEFLRQLNEKDSHALNKLKIFTRDELKAQAFAELHDEELAIEAVHFALKRFKNRQEHFESLVAVQTHLWASMKVFCFSIQCPVAGYSITN